MPGKCKYTNGLRLDCEFDEYIPFEPKDNDRKSDHKCLSESLQKLKNNENKILQATYSAEKIKARADLDNILFYNFWYYNKSLFNHLCQKGLSFEFQSLCMSKHHYYQYELVDKEEPFPRYWDYDCDNLLIEWKDIHCQSHIQDIICCTKNKSGAHFFWYALKSNPKFVKVHSRLNETKETPNFCLQIEVSVPERQSVDLAILEKAIIDGTISAFHRCIPNICDTREMSDRIGIPDELFRDYLYCEDISILKRKKLITKAKTKNDYYNKWNPDDHLCMFGEIILNNDIENDNCKFSGKLYTVKQK